MEDVSKSRGEKGITLIALVITIIVLLILAGVTINLTLGERGIFTTAQRAAKETKEASKKEETALSRYEFEMEKALGKVEETETYGEYSMEQEIKAKYGVDIKVGDTVNYNANVPEYDGTWKLLGIEDGKILLMSSKPVKDEFELTGIDGYVHGVEKLDEECGKYGTGEGAKGARSLRAEDINRIMDYDPANPLKGKKYREGQLQENGNKVTFTKINDNVTRTGSNGVSDEWTNGLISYIDDNGNLKQLEGQLNLTNDAYEYTISTRRIVSRWTNKQ